MDPFDIMLNLDRVVPYYQPVISADTQLIVGYEVMANFQSKDGEIVSLDWFFEDPSIPDDFRLELYNLVLQKAIDYYLETDSSAALFFTYNAQLLFKDAGEILLDLLKSYEEKGLNLNKIIIQLKEQFAPEEIDSIQKLFIYIKSHGIQIAIDNVGEWNGNLDRLAFLRPNILKLDAGVLKDNELPHLYRDVHHSLSLLSQKIGATLMFKEISTYNQLNHAWRNGGRYYQGSYFKRPQSEFQEPDCCKDIIQNDFHLFVSFERKKVKAQMNLANRILQQFNTTLGTINSEEPYDEIILKIGTSCSNFAFRVYICNEEGLQLSSNAEKNKEGKWELKEEGRNKNWSWRPYFFENIARMDIEKKGILSDLYTDIARAEQIRTYSYPISEGLYIFLDIPYEYLYEQEGLL